MAVEVNIQRSIRRKPTNFHNKILVATIFIFCVFLIASHSVILEFMMNIVVPEFSKICEDKVVKSYTALHGTYWIFYNYFKAHRKFGCYESVTFTTHGDLTHLDHLEPLLKRWNGPVSLAMYAPGGDLYKTVNAIRYAQDCLSPLVREYVTFHIYCEYKYLPTHIPRAENLLSRPVNCSTIPPWKHFTPNKLYKHQNNLLYPINVARNIARETATTYFVLACDIELYPNPGLIDYFLTLMNQTVFAQLSYFHVYPLHIFEIERLMNLPETKSEMLKMLWNETAYVYHTKICYRRHALPGTRRWLDSNETYGPQFTFRGKRKGRLTNWEPVFIGTKFDPLYDERMSSEGGYDRMSQAYIMCLQEYEFLILNNAFLVYQPKAGRKLKLKKMFEYEMITKNILQTKYIPELISMYGRNRFCVL